jgi:hypothetical protein
MVLLRQSPRQSSLPRHGLTTLRLPMTKLPFAKTVRRTKGLKQLRSLIIVSWSSCYTSGSGSGHAFSEMLAQLIGQPQFWDKSLHFPSTLYVPYRELRSRFAEDCSLRPHWANLDILMVNSI